MPKARWRRSTTPTVLAVAAALTLAAPASAATTYQVFGTSRRPSTRPRGRSRCTAARRRLVDYRRTPRSRRVRSIARRAPSCSPAAWTSGAMGRARAIRPERCSFSFKYWAQFDEQGALVWGTCTHPITGGTGAFAGATGVLAMVDTPTPAGRVDVVHRERHAPRIARQPARTRARARRYASARRCADRRLSVGATRAPTADDLPPSARSERLRRRVNRSMNPRRALDGTSLGTYEVGAQIGRGGMGEVYLARDTRLGRPVALKVLPARFAQDERFRERLLRESRLAASLDHPNVVPVYDAGEVDGRLFIAMRYVDGARPAKALLRDSAPLGRGAGGGDRRSDRRGARRRPSARPRAPRRQAEQRAARPAGRP